MSILRNDFTVTSGISTMADHGIADGLPIVLFTATEGGDQDLSFIFNNGGGDLTGSTANSHVEGTNDVPSVVSIEYDDGDGDPGTTTSIITMFVEPKDSQDIARCIANSLQFTTDRYGVANGNNVEVSYAGQGERTPPVVTVTEAGTSGLAASDFTVTQTQAGIPTALTTDYPNIMYSLGDIAATTNGWNFQSSITGPMTTLTAWPTTGDVFLHIGLTDIVLDDIETTLGLAEITQTMQDVTPDATLTFDFNFLDLTPATSTYQITGVRLVSTATGTALGVRLDGTTGVQSLAGTDPLFEDEQVVGLNFFRRQMGAVNDAIPPEGLTGTPDYSTDQNLADGTFGFFDGGTSGANNIELTEWPTTGIIYLRSQDEFNLATIRDVLGLSGFPFLTPLAVTHSTHLTISDGAGNEATYRVTMASIVSIGRLDELCLELDATTLSRESGTPAYTAGDTLTITFANPLDFTDFYNANDGSNT